MKKLQEVNISSRLPIIEGRYLVEYTHNDFLSTEYFNGKRFEIDDNYKIKSWFEDVTETTAEISIETGISIPEDGLLNLWWWQSGNKLNIELEPKKPIWDIFNAKQVYELCCNFGTIKVDISILRKNYNIMQN